MHVFLDSTKKVDNNFAREQTFRIFPKVWGTMI